MRKITKWYPVSFLGGLVTSLYGLVPVYTVYVDNLHLLTDTGRILVAGGMGVVLVLALHARVQGRKLFVRKLS